MSLQLLGGLSAAQFMARHWQKRPLLIRRAIPDFKGIIQIPELLRLARREDVESRIVERRGRRWDIRHGPFPRAALARAPSRNWTLLVQGVNLHSDAAAGLLERFSFLSRARLDDVMVSLAAPGGGVGPHVDSYDVFLLQGPGRRRWSISSAPQGRIVPGAPLAVLARFEPESEWVLDPGDMLYLPPGCAHDGVALDRCTTYSIGFRAPGAREIASALLTHLEEALEQRFAGRRYADPGARPAARPGLLPPGMIDFARSVARDLRAAGSDVETSLGEYLSEPKAHVSFQPPSSPWSRAVFERRARARGLVLDRRTILLYRGSRFFANGDCLPAPAGGRALLRRLADERGLPPGLALPGGLRKLLHDWYVHGWLHAR